MPSLKKPLTITVHHDHATLACFDKLGNIRAETKVSLEDIERIQQADTLWSITGDGYVIAGKGQKREYLHRWLMNPPKGLEVDHINRDRTDNRRCNLRVVTHAENMMNMGEKGRNKTGYRGVYQDKYGMYYGRCGDRHIPGSRSRCLGDTLEVVRRYRGEA